MPSIGLQFYRRRMAVSHYNDSYVVTQQRFLKVRSSQIPFNSSKKWITQLTDILLIRVEIEFYFWHLQQSRNLTFSDKNSGRNSYYACLLEKNNNNHSCNGTNTFYIFVHVLYSIPLYFARLQFSISAYSSFLKRRVSTHILLTQSSPGEIPNYSPIKKYRSTNGSKIT